MRSQDYWHDVDSRFPDDWPAMARQALALSPSRVEDYVAALAGGGPLRPQVGMAGNSWLGRIGRREALFCRCQRLDPFCAVALYADSRRTSRRSRPALVAQEPQPPAELAIRIVLPEADSYVSGMTTLKAEIVPQDAGVARRARSCSSPTASWCATCWTRRAPSARGTPAPKSRTSFGSSPT